MSTTPNVFTNGLDVEVVVVQRPTISHIRALLLAQKQIICRRAASYGVPAIHMVITGVRVAEGVNANRDDVPYTVVGFSILPDNYNDLVNDNRPDEIHVAEFAKLQLRDVRRCRHLQTISGVRWISVVLRGNVRTNVKASELRYNTEGLMYYKISGSPRQWHGTHFIIEPEKTAATTRMMLNHHYAQLADYVNPLEKGTLIKDKRENEYIVLKTFEPREVAGNYVDMLIVNGSMSAPLYAYSYDFEVVREQEVQA